MLTGNFASAQWFALRIKSNRENVTSLGLTSRGYEVFLPRLRRSRVTRSEPEEVPLFPGYLFCRFDITNRLPILILPGVVHIVGMGKIPVPVEDREIESLRVLIKTGFPINAHEAYTVGQQIKIVRGPLSGAEGVVVGFRDKRFVVSIALLQRSVSIVLRPEWLTSNAASPAGSWAMAACQA